MDKYVNEKGEFVFLVHKFILPDGKLGGCGKPDPKRMAVGGVVYYCD